MNRHLKALFLVLLIVLVSVFAVFAEDNDEKQPVIYQEVFYSPDYLVTPGDIYTLSYNALGATVRYTIVVDPTFNVRVSNLGVIDAEGKTFFEFKKEVEEIVSSNFPMSGVQLVLSVPGPYKIVVRGEVSSVVERKLTGLVRVSEIVAAYGTKYASSRFVTIEDAKGSVSRYDLFLAQRFGDLSQNPYVRPNDIVTIERAGRRVSIGGSVERPGTYELTETENLKRLVEYYAGGLDPLADTSHITLTRSISDSAKAGEVFYLKETSISDDYALVNLDSISIGSVKSLKNTIFINGAVRVQIAETLEGEVATKNIRYEFEEGETYLDFIRNHRDWFTDVADFERSYLYRKGQRLPIDIYSMLFNKEYSDDSLKLEAEDTLVIPFRQYIVVKGEVSSVVERELTGFVRVSEIVAAYGTKYASSRFVTIEDAKGSVSRYDLFLAQRFGDLSQNPYVRPNDIVTIERAGRRVSIGGSVERPGTYELTETENLKRLVEYYAGGLDPLADTSHITLTRSISDSAKAGEVFYLKETSISDDYALVNLDSISIGSVKSLKNTIFINGAVRVQIAETLEGEVATKNIRYEFEEGETYLDFIRNHRDWFTDVADFERSYLYRKGQRLPIDIYSMLFNKEYSDDSLKLESEDTLVIPFRQYFVTVTGAVKAPGRFAYVPDRTWDYYVGLAGGFDQDRNVRDAVDIRTSDGQTLTKDDYIVPEAMIDAKSNSFLYGFNKYATPLLTVLSIITSSISLYMFFSNI